MQDERVHMPDLSEVFAAHDVAVAYLFGSRAEGTAGPTSDHDVAVLFANRNRHWMRRSGSPPTWRGSWAPTSTSSTWTARNWSCGAALPNAGGCCTRRTRSAEFASRSTPGCDGSSSDPSYGRPTQAYLRRVAAEGLRG